MLRVLIPILLLIFSAPAVLAYDKGDYDRDGINNYDEQAVYFTNAWGPDTDGDGYGDKEELVNGYSPYVKGKIKLEDSDFDNDGLSDRMELNFHLDPTDPDTDKDGYSDGEEIKNAYNPLVPGNQKLEKRIEINTTKQELDYFLGGVRLGRLVISSGKPSMPTPKGHFTIGNKITKAWSRAYGLWMPYWMGMAGTRFGIHELPEWPNGYKEGANHLGIAVSHGCIRLGVGPAKSLYSWAEVGTKVYIH